MTDAVPAMADRLTGDDAPLFQRVALIGLGLIAGSMAHAIRDNGLAARITGYARSAATRNEARALNLCEVMESAAEAVRGADLVVLGRHGHEAHGNRSGRLRMVVSTSADGIEMRGTDWWWNPARVSWPEAAARVLPEGGRVAVPGGRRVFDLFLGIGFTAFHLSRAERVEIADGVAVFSACGDGRSAEDVLAASGLQPGPSEMIDPEACVSLVVWR